MLLRNLNNNLINGSRGVIVRFKPITDEDKQSLLEKGISGEWISKNRVNLLILLIILTLAVFANCEICWP